MITFEPDAVALHQAAVDAMWNRSLKCQVAADGPMAVLAADGKPRDGDDL